MQTSSIPHPLDATRRFIAKRVRELRQERRWTQAELAAQLHLSQSRLSEIERGDGSFTAEQLLEIFRIFNVNPDHFDAAPARPHPEAEFQNALARLGAHHLTERPDLLPTQRLREAGSTIREILTAGGPPRLLLALAPVVVWNIDSLPLHRIHGQLMELGLENRLLWLLENILLSLSNPAAFGNLEWIRHCRRAKALIEDFIISIPFTQKTQSFDPLDKNIYSKKSIQETISNASPCSLKYRILTDISPLDFANALQHAITSR